MIFFHIDADITKAETLPSHFYKSQEVFDLMKDKVFVKAWQWIGDVTSMVLKPETVYPFIFLENYINEPLLFIRDSNSCLLYTSDAADE